MASDSGRQETEEFASWLQHLRLDAGQPSLRDLSRLTRETAGREVPRSTLASAFAGQRLPSYDNAMAIVRALAGPDRLDEAHRRWRQALGARRGEAVPDEPVPDGQVPDGPAAVPVGSTPVPAGRSGRLRWLVAAGVVAVLVVTAGVVTFVAGAGGGAPGHGTSTAGTGTSAGPSPLQLGVTEIGDCTPAYFADLDQGHLDADLAATKQAQSAGTDGTLPYPIDPTRAGVPADQRSIRITVQSAGDEAVLITGMSIVVRHREAAPDSGVFVTLGEGCGAHVDIRFFRTDLSHRQPSVSPEEAGKDFPFSVSRSDPEVFQLDAFEKVDRCTFDVQLDWTAAGRQGHTLLTNGGHHYELTGVGHRPAYLADGYGRSYLLPDPDPNRLD